MGDENRMDVSEVPNSMEMEESEPIANNELVADIPKHEDTAFKAIRFNDLTTLTRRLNEGFDVNNVHEEVANDNVYTIKDLSRMVRQMRLKAYSLLHVAVIHGTVETIRLLLSHGANVNAVDVNHICPLSIAAAIQRLDVVRLLLENGANVNNQSISGRTPLIQAINVKNIPIVRQLISAGADLELADTKGMTPLFMCIHAQVSPHDHEILRTVIEGVGNIDHPNSRGATALMLAVGFGRKDLAEILLEAGADINMMDKSNKMPFSFAAGVNTAKFLMEHGATTDWPDKAGQRPLDKAVHTGHIGMMRLLLGSDSQRSPAILEVPRVIQVREQLPVFDQWLHDELQNPRELKRLCRQTIRQSLGPCNTKYIQDLPVPSVMKDFLLGKHVQVSF